MIIFPNTSRVFKRQLCIQDVRVGKEVMYHEIFHTRDSRLRGRKIFDWANRPIEAICVNLFVETKLFGPTKI